MLEIPTQNADQSEAAAGQWPTADRRYWKRNLQLIAQLLAVWLGATYLPVLLVRQLNQFGFLTGFPLGYYMGAQGALIIFVALVFYYAWRMDALDREYASDQATFEE